MRFVVKSPNSFDLKIPSKVLCSLIHWERSWGDRTEYDRCGGKRASERKKNQLMTFCVHKYNILKSSHSKWTAFFPLYFGLYNVRSHITLSILFASACVCLVGVNFFLCVFCWFGLVWLAIQSIPNRIVSMLMLQPAVCICDAHAPTLTTMAAQHFEMPTNTHTRARWRPNNHSIQPQRFKTQKFFGKILPPPLLLLLPMQLHRKRNQRSDILLLCCFCFAFVQRSVNACIPNHLYRLASSFHIRNEQSNARLENKMMKMMEKKKKKNEWGRHVYHHCNRIAHCIWFTRAHTHTRSLMMICVWKRHANRHDRTKLKRT